MHQVYCVVQASVQALLVLPWLYTGHWPKFFWLKSLKG
jgi:hypothetical protein